MSTTNQYEPEQLRQIARHLDRIDVLKGESVTKLISIVMVPGTANYILGLDSSGDVWRGHLPGISGDAVKWENIGRPVPLSLEEEQAEVERLEVGDPDEDDEDDGEDEATA